MDVIKKTNKEFDKKTTTDNDIIFIKEKMTKDIKEILGNVVINVNSPLKSKSSSKIVLQKKNSILSKEKIPVKKSVSFKNSAIYTKVNKGEEENTLFKVSKHSSNKLYYRSLTFDHHQEENVVSILKIKRNNSLKSVTSSNSNKKKRKKEVSFSDPISIIKEVQSISLFLNNNNKYLDTSNVKCNCNCLIF